jgi:hypothetical protein
MTTTLLVLALAVCGAADTPETKEKPKHSPYAPSLPYLTKEEEDKLDEIIDRFMLYDIGRLQGEAARKALEDFKALGPESIPALLRGLNRAATMEASCPVVTIAQKLGSMLAKSDDEELLEFARDNIGAGVGRTRHAGVLQDLRVGVTLRKNMLARRPKTTGPKAPRVMSLTELADAASTERGPRLKVLLAELERRNGKEVLPGLANAAASYDKEIKQLGRSLLVRHLSRQSEAVIREKLQDDIVEVRKAAMQVVVNKLPRLVPELIDLLSDEKAEVRTAAHDALVRLNRNQDLGPAADDDKDKVAAAQEKWRNWWMRQGRR